MKEAVNSKQETDYTTSTRWMRFVPFRRKPESNNPKTVGSWSQVAVTCGDVRDWFRISNDGFSPRFYKTKTHETPPPGPFIDIPSPQERVRMNVAINVAQRAREYNNIDLENAANYIKGVMILNSFPDDDMYQSLHRTIFKLKQLGYSGYEEHVQNLRRWLLETTRGSLEARWDEIMLVHSGRVAEASAHENDANARSSARNAK